MLIRISEDAPADLNDGFWFYEHQEFGLGDYFRASIQADITSLKVFAGMHRVDFRDYHRLICKTFPLRHLLYLRWRGGSRLGRH